MIKTHMYIPLDIQRQRKAKDRAANAEYCLKQGHLVWNKQKDKSKVKE